MTPSSGPALRAPRAAALPARLRCRGRCQARRGPNHVGTRPPPRPGLKQALGPGAVKGATSPPSTCEARPRPRLPTRVPQPPTPGREGGREVKTAPAPPVLSPRPPGSGPSTGSRAGPGRFTGARGPGTKWGPASTPTRRPRPPPSSARPRPDRRPARTSPRAAGSRRTCVVASAHRPQRTGRRTPRRPRMESEPGNRRRLRKKRRRAGPTSNQSAKDPPSLRNTERLVQWRAGHAPVGLRVPGGGTFWRAGS